MRWSGATDATARCKSRSTGCARKRRSGRVLPWICGVKPKPKAVNKPSPHSIMHGLDKPGVFTTVAVGDRGAHGEKPRPLPVAFVVTLFLWRFRGPNMHYATARPRRGERPVLCE